MKNHDLEIKRNAFHLMLGVGLAFTAYFLGSKLAIPLFCLALIFGLLLSELIKRNYNIPFFSWMIGKMERKKVRPGHGAFMFFIGAILCLIYFPIKTVFLSLIILATCDSFSTVFGKMYGKHRIWHKKTLEGFTAGFIATLLVTSILLPLWFAIIISFAGSVSELLSPINDNITVPMSTAITITFLSLI